MCRLITQDENHRQNSEQHHHHHAPADCDGSNLEPLYRRCIPMFIVMVRIVNTSEWIFSPVNRRRFICNISFADQSTVSISPATRDRQHRHPQSVNKSASSSSSSSSIRDGCRFGLFPSSLPLIILGGLISFDFHELCRLAKHLEDILVTL